MVKFYTFILLLSSFVSSFAQTSPEEYGQNIYEMIITGNRNLNEQFIDLNQYSTYIDNLNTLEEIEKDNMKYGAEQNYSDIRHDFDTECNRILDLYADDTDYGTQFKFEICEFESNKSFPNLGMITCYYIADIPREEEGLFQRVIVQEFAYWLISTYWNLQEPYGPLEEEEWNIDNKEQLLEKELILD